jgi:tetratricopeptide (TPR) repeat protein
MKSMKGRLRALECFQRGELTSALKIANESLHGEESPELQNLRGLILTRLGQDTEAIEAFQRALVMRPDYGLARCNLGVSLQKIGRVELALACWEETIRVAPRFPDPYVAVALVKIGRRELDAAEVLLRTAVGLDSHIVPAHTNLGLIHQLRGDLAAAMSHYQRALAIDRCSVAAHINVATVLHLQGQHAAARDGFARALSLEPSSVPAQYNLSQELLLLGEYEEGWRLYESRFEWWKQHGATWPQFPQPRWKGEDLQGKTLLLVAEQGLGDTLQFIRYAPVLARRGARIVAQCQAPLVELIRDVEGIAAVVAAGSPVPAADFYCPLLSLPLNCRTTIASIPHEIPYIQPRDGLRREWAARTDCRELRVGVALKGNDRRDDYDQRRSMSIDDFRPILLVEGVKFFSIQKEPLDLIHSGSSGTAEIIDFPEELKGFAQTAALVAHLDLVITVDTALVHLAGAMGRPVWLMSKLDPCWRWMLERDDSLWYPTVRIFRQKSMGDWRQVTRVVADELNSYVGGRRLGRGHLMESAG